MTTYQRERDDCLVTLTREGLPPHVAYQLLRAASGLHRRAELACSSEAADRDRVPCPATRPTPGPCLCDQYHGQHETIPRIALQDWQAEQRLRAALPADWGLLTAGDPRGYTLRVIPPSHAARNAGRDVHNLDGVGIPARPSARLRW
jgi:hypothetical protein